MEAVFLGIVIVLIIVAAVLRFKFDMRYTLPAIAENKDLSMLNIIAYAAVAVIFISLLTKQYTLFIISLIIGIPLLLYVNFRTYFFAIKKFFEK
jgi:hypothetical protein